MNKNLIVLSAILFAFIQVFSQNATLKTYPVIGQPCPDFTLTDVNNYSRKQITLKDLRGKHVILDLWAKDCMGCIASFPKWNALQKKFGDKLQVILIGLHDQERNVVVKDIYEKYRKKFNLDLPVAFDSALFFPPFKMIDGVPWIIWIDDMGIVKAIVQSSDVNEKNISDFISGRELVVTNASYDNHLKRDGLYHRALPIYFQNNGGMADTSFSFRSAFGPWKPEMAGQAALNIDVLFEKGRQNPMPKVEIMQQKLLDMFSLAYSGEWHLPNDFYFWPEFGKDVDTTLFKGGDPVTGTGFYNYSLIVPKERAEKGYVMRCMQNDLENYFGYRGRIVEKEMPCKILKVTNKNKFEKIKSKPGTKPSWDESPDYMRCTNISINQVTGRILELSKSPAIRLFNETGYYGKVDVDLELLILDFNDVRRALNTVGLDIVDGKHKMKVLEIYKSDN